jgi:hypothetical protein
MAASKSQGSYFGLFVVGATLLCGGVAYLASGTGRLLLLLGAVISFAAYVGFRRIKPLEGRTPVESGPDTMKWMGAGLALLGWLITLGGLHVVEGNGARIVLALVGIGASLLGMLYVLPAAFNKRAFWKTGTGTSARSSLVPVAGKSMVEPAYTATPHAMESAR